MKIHTSHISNSSSCSFVIKYTGYPFENLYDQIIAKTSTLTLDESWNIDIDENDSIHCSTSMDNFDLYEYVTETLHYPEKYIEIEYWG